MQYLNLLSYSFKDDDLLINDIIRDHRDKPECLKQDCPLLGKGVKCTRNHGNTVYLDGTRDIVTYKRKSIVNLVKWMPYSTRGDYYLCVNLTNHAPAILNSMIKGVGHYIIVSITCHKWQFLLSNEALWLTVLLFSSALMKTLTLPKGKALSRWDDQS